MRSSRGRAAHSSPVTGGKRGKGGSSGSRTKKKQKRLDAICDSLPPAAGSSIHGAVRESTGETSDAGLVRRSTRVRKATVFVDFSPEPFYPKIRKSETRGGHVGRGGSGGRPRLKGRNAVALDVEAGQEVAPLEDAVKVETSHVISDGEEAADQCLKHSSRFEEGQTDASAECKKISLAKSNDQCDEDDRLLRPAEGLKKTLDAPPPESYPKVPHRRKIKGRKSRLRNQSPHQANDSEESRLRDCSLREQEASAFPSRDNEEDHEETILKEVTQTVGETKTYEGAFTHVENKSSSRGDVAEAGTVAHEESISEDEKHFASEVPSSPPDAKNCSEEALGEDFADRKMPDSRSACSSRTSLDEYLAEEEEEDNDDDDDDDGDDDDNDGDETSKEKVSLEEEGRTIAERVSPAGETVIQQDLASGDALQENGREEISNIPCQLENGIIDDQEGMQIPESQHISKHRNASRPDYSRVREGRRCGLCGGGTDGKPPKRLILASPESDNEQYNGSSSSEEPTFDVWDGFGEEPDWLGRLLGPTRDRHGIARVWVHQQCAVWSPEVYFAGVGRLKNVRAALCRGRALKCSRCGRPGATIGCRVDRCPKTYHLPCARAENSVFDHRKFLIACSDHRHLFQPQGNNYLQRIKKMKMKKMRSDLKKLSHEAWRKDLEAEDKWLENCGEDEEFLKREGKRLHRDMMRIAPVFIGGPSSESDTSAFKGWESVAGHKDVIQSLKEVVILPLLYPEVFISLGLTPPRGVLLHGYPGTGKTHVVRALIGECSRGDKRIAYFARKGADCLGKYVGDAERQLRLLFQIAEKSQPSIIFFDEIDGLAPCRSKRQDQTHNSVVATLLSLLDGLKSRGSVVVIGATNRPDSVDPALRRPGRFDREIYFPLPSVKDRSGILSLQTKNWPKPLSGSLLSWVAKETAGYAGADLQALCTQAAMIALKRNCPLHEILVSAEKHSRIGKQPPLPLFSVVERDWLSALASAPPPCSRREAGMAANEVVTAPLPTHLIPCLLLPLCHLLIDFYFNERIWVPFTLFEASKSVKDVIVSALEQMGKPVTSWKSHLPCLIQKPDIALEIKRHLSSLGFLSSTSTLVPSGTSQDDNDDNDKVSKFDSFVHSSSKRGVSVGLGKPSGFRVLITGTRRSGQQHLAACLLDQFLGHVEIQKVNLSTASHEGCGDVILGITQIISKCMHVGSCVVYMPRLDLWAMDEVDQAMEEREYQNPGEVSGTEEREKTANRSSVAWDSFLEHMDSMSRSSSLIVLATCEMASHDIPARVRSFFSTNVSSSEHTIPRFFVEVNGNVDHHAAIRSSVSRISCDIIKQYVQLIHQRSHASCMHDDTKTVQENNFPRKTSDGDIDHGASSSVDQNSAIQVNSSNRIMKGNSSLMIAALGYQILQYPQFAELCWATSKVKDGPHADVSGPWKIWPFNSCIVRPHDIAEKSTSPSTSRNIKNKEISGIVRGLAAVGLLAYRGSYTSVMEVSSQVRTVFELLVGLIGEKIQSGRDRYSYSRILSQVAYVEDLVNSWAYTFLRSSGKIDEGNCANDSKMLENDPSAAISCDKHQALMGHGVELPGVDPAASVKSSVEISSVEDINPVNSEPSENIKPLTSSEVLCLYDCCPDCLRLVNASVQEIVTRWWKARGQPLTVDHVHDIVTLCSLNLVSTVRKRFLSLDDAKAAEGVEFFPSECSLHSGSRKDSRSTPRLKFWLRDGTLLTSDPPEGAELHCRFGKLCVHSVTEMVTSVEFLGV